MQNYTGYGWEGKNHDDNLTTKDISRIIRGKLKEKYPGCKFSVRFENYSGGSSLHVCLMAAPWEAILDQGAPDPMTNRYQTNEERGFPVNKGYEQLNEYRFNEEYDFCHDARQIPAGWNNGSVLSRKAWDTMKGVAEMINSFRRNDSDAMIDYFDTNFYMHLNIGRWDKPFQILN